jgi:hypothetical protein
MSDGNRSTGGTKSFALTPAEKEYLESGVTGSYRRSQLESRVEEKARSLPGRIGRLADDVETLAENGYLSGEDGQVIWRVLLADALDVSSGDVEGGVTEWNTGAVPRTPVTEFGRQMGNLTHELLHTSEQSDIFEVITHLVFGFAQGVYVDHIKAGVVEEHGVDEIMSNLVADVESLAGEAEERREAFFDAGQFQNNVEARRRARSSFERHVRQVLHEAGIVDQPPRSLEAILENRQSQSESSNGPSEDAEVVESMEEYQQAMRPKATSLVQRTVGHLILNDVDSDSLPNTWGASMEFWTEHDPNDFDPEEFATADEVLEVFETKQIHWRVLLERQVRDDRNWVKERSWRGVDASKILELIHLHEPISSAAINDRLEARKDYTAQVTRLARDLAGENSETRDTKEELPLVTGNKTGWQLTEYGQILASYWFDHDHWSVDALPEPQIEAGIDLLSDAEIE